MIVEEWDKIVCECGAINWIFYGDPADLTWPDVLGFICHECKAPHSFSDEIMVKMGEGIDPEEFEIGRKKPEI
jgi:hypothetical protein